MTTMMPPTAATETMPTVEELVERAAGFRALLEELAPVTEKAGRVSADVTNRLKQAGLLKLGQPRRFGGYGYPLSAMLQLGFEFGKACPSTSWCAMIANSNSWIASYWPLEVQEQIWGRTPDSLVCISGVPTGKCRIVDGGYEVWGAWPYASNCDNSDWLIVAAPLSEPDGAAPETAWFLVPRSELSIDHDSWDVVGMRGTGSKTLLRKEPLFVPRINMVKLSQVTEARTPGSAIPGNTLAAFNFSTLGGIMLIGPMLGAAQGAIEWFLGTMKTKLKTTIKAGAAAPASLTPAIQARVGDASARVDAAMALIAASLTRFERKLVAGEAVSVADRVLIRRNIGFAARQASEAISIIVEGAGASAMYANVPLQRLWRDVIAGTRHITLDTDGIYTMYGQERFGLQPVGPF